VGQKVNPIGFRIGVIRDWESKWYAEKGFSDLLYEDYKLRRFVRKKLANAAISRIEIERAANRVTVKLHTGKPGVIIGRGGKGVDELRADLEKLTGKQVHVSVQEIRHPELDAQLVAESVAQQIEKRVAYKRAVRQAIMRSTRAGAKGIKIQVAGRLGGAEIARREMEPRGSKVPLHTLRADIDYGFAVAATTYGNIGVKVWIYKGDVIPGVRQPLSETAEVGARIPRRLYGDETESYGPGGGGRGGRGGGRGGRGGRGGGRSGRSGRPGGG